VNGFWPENGSGNDPCDLYRQLRTPNPSPFRFPFTGWILKLKFSQEKTSGIYPFPTSVQQHLIGDDVDKKYRSQQTNIFSLYYATQIVRVFFCSNYLYSSLSYYKKARIVGCQKG
jgi:hypothetical protein